MRRPISGWPKYKEAKRQNDPEYLDLGKLAAVFIVWGVIGLLTSWHYSHGWRSQDFSFHPKRQIQMPASISSAQDLAKAIESIDTSGNTDAKNRVLENVVGPIEVRKKGQVFDIKITANLALQSWAFIEGEVLDGDKEYLYSFGKELWYETGRDSDGKWTENKNSYDMKVTFPQSGKYYLNFKVESSNRPSRVNVKVTRKNGSSLPHFWFGVMAIIVGLIMNEIKNRTIANISSKMDDSDEESNVFVSYIGLAIFFIALLFMFAG